MFLIGTLGDFKKVRFWLNKRDCNYVINDGVHVAPDLD
jgi:hypothetical protein